MGPTSLAQQDRWRQDIYQAVDEETFHEPLEQRKHDFQCSQGFIATQSSSGKDEPRPHLSGAFDELSPIHLASDCHG